MKIFRIVAALMIGLVASVALVQPASAAGFPRTGDAYFKNDSSIGVGVCRSLDNQAGAAPHCSPHYARRVLPAGATTESWNWEDTDAVAVGAGWYLTFPGITTHYVGYGHTLNTARLIKRSGCVNPPGIKTCTRHFTVHRL